MFKLICGDYHPDLESTFVDTLLDEMTRRKNPLTDRILVVVPSSALRNQLLTAIAGKRPQHMCGIVFRTIDHLAREIVMRYKGAHTRPVDDAVFFAMAIRSITGKPLKIAAAIYQTLRDIEDALISPADFEELAKFINKDDADLLTLSNIYKDYRKFKEENNLIDLGIASATALDFADEWASQFCSTIVYGFYDATQSQFDLLCRIMKPVLTSGNNAYVFFPFPVEGSRVVHPNSFAQPFYTDISLFCGQVNGKIIRIKEAETVASKGIEKQLFLDHPSSVTNAAIEIFNAAGTYDEVWTVAKRIVNLVSTGKATFDQIMVICRSADEYRLAVQQVFEENSIPVNGAFSKSIAGTAFGRFILFILRACRSKMPNAMVMEFLTSPFVRTTEPISPVTFRRVAGSLFIKNWDDWEHLDIAAKDKELCMRINLIDEENDNFEELINLNRSLQGWKKSLSKIPEKGNLSSFARRLRELLDERFEEIDAEGKREILRLLDRLSEYKWFVEGITIGQFTNLIQDYFSNEKIEEDEPAATSRVTFGGLMQLRGTSADYVFVLGLNKDEFPRPELQDPFLPDVIRKQINAAYGTSLKEKKRHARVIAEKEGTNEELLLYYICLRSARKRLFLSYKRADNEGRKQSASTYLEELVALMTGKSLEKAIESGLISEIPKYHKNKFKDGVLPTLDECATLPDTFKPSKICQENHGLSGEYVASITKYAQLLNGYDGKKSQLIDGKLMPVADDLWNLLAPKKKYKISYTRLKTYVACPFQFYGKYILGLEESPISEEEDEYGLSNLVLGNWADEIVKASLKGLRKTGKQAIASIVSKNAAKVLDPFRKFVPKALLDDAQKQLTEGVTNLLVHLTEEESFDAAKILLPDEASVVSISELIQTWEYLSHPGIKEKDLQEIRGNIEALADTLRKIGVDIQIEGIPDIIYGNITWMSDIKWDSSAVSKSASTMAGYGEMQFCVYPFLFKRPQEILAFKYFRIKMFANYGTPSQVKKMLASHDIREQNCATPISVFGKEIETADIIKYNSTKVAVKLEEMMSGSFRIKENPYIEQPPCSYCNFPLLCRMSHPPTLCRNKKEE